MTELEYIPVVHPYIYEHELSLHSYFVRLVEEGYIRVIQYNEFQKDATSIYNTHKQGSSMGDVHMILMASYLQMPILLTEDSDIELLRDIAKRRMRLGQYSLQILNGVQLIEEIAKKQDSSITVKEIEVILKAMRERNVIASIKAVWRENHPV